MSGADPNRVGAEGVGIRDPHRTAAVAGMDDEPHGWVAELRRWAGRPRRTRRPGSNPPRPARMVIRVDSRGPQKCDGDPGANQRSVLDGFEHTVPSGACVRPPGGTAPQAPPGIVAPAGRLYSVLRLESKTRRVAPSSHPVSLAKTRSRRSRQSIPRKCAIDGTDHGCNRGAPTTIFWRLPPT